MPLTSSLDVAGQGRRGAAAAACSTPRQVREKGTKMSTAGSGPRYKDTIHSYNYSYRPQRFTRHLPHDTMHGRRLLGVMHWRVNALAPNAAANAINHTAAEHYVIRSYWHVLYVSAC